jgi:hypothetical protein
MVWYGGDSPSCSTPPATRWPTEGLPEPLLLKSSLLTVSGERGDTGQRQDEGGMRTSDEVAVAVAGAVTRRAGRWENTTACRKSLTKTWCCV